MNKVPSDGCGHISINHSNVLVSPCLLTRWYIYFFGADVTLCAGTELLWNHHSFRFEVRPVSAALAYGKVIVLRRNLGTAEIQFLTNYGEGRGGKAFEPDNRRQRQVLSA